jgi:HK97 family phage portal protein
MRPLKSDGTTTTTVPTPEERIAGEELWWPPGGSAGMVVTEQTALQLPSLLAAVNTLATDTALMPMGVYQRTDDGSRREAREHPADRLLRISPNGETTPLRWRQSWMLHALLHGNGYAEIQRTGRGAPYALHLLDPCTTCAKREGGRLGYALDGGRWLEAANVLHLAGIGFDGVTGYNFVRLLRQAIGLGMGAESYAADYFANGAEPGGVIESPAKLNPEGRANLRDGWHGRHGGPGRRHSVAVLEQGAKWVATTTDPEKSQLSETRKYQLLDTIRPWRVPPNKAGDYSQAHLANLESSNLDYLMTALMGWITGIEQECTFKLLTVAEQAKGFYIEANTKALLRGDTASRNASYEVALRNGWMSRNEVRKAENLDPIPADQGGDLFTVQAQNIPLDKVGQEKGPMLPPAALPGAREARHNPHHGHDGKFSSGGAGHSGLGGVFSPDRTIKAGGKELTPGAIAGHAAAMQGEGVLKGHDWSVEVAKPGSAREEAAVAKTERAGKLLVRRVTHAKVTEEVHDDETHIFEGGNHAATVRPKKGKDATGYVADLGPAQAMGSRKTHDTEAGALAHARDHVARKVARQARQDSEYKAVDDLGSHLAKEAQTFLPFGGLHASTHKTTWRVIAPDQRP